LPKREGKFLLLPDLAASDIAPLRHAQALPKFAGMKADRRLAVETAVFRAWCDLENARGGPEDELVFSQFCTELSLIEERDGETYLNFERLYEFADLEMRRATLTVAQKALEEGETG
jgi:hypothetical protein